MTATSQLVATTPLGYRHLVSEQLWEQLVGRLIKDEGWSRDYAELVQNEALVFVHYIATRASEAPASPSPTVDKGWHNLILHTKAYFRLCEQLGVGYIHHHPNDVTVVNVDTDAVSRTVAIMLEVGYPVLHDLWPASNECSHTEPTNPVTCQV